MTLLVGSIFHMTRKIVSEMTYNVSMGTLNPTIPNKQHTPGTNGDVMLHGNHKQRQYTETAEFINEDVGRSNSPAKKRRRLASNDRRRQTSTNITSKAYNFRSRTLNKVTQNCRQNHSFLLANTVWTNFWNCLNSLFITVNTVNCNCPNE